MNERCDQSKRNERRRKKHSFAENLAMGAYVRRDRKRKRAAHERVCAYFPVLARRHDQIAGTLSGGEQQMLAFGRALMAEPRIMLFDEPSLGLAPLVVREIFALLETINRVDGVTIVLAEQNAMLPLAAAAYAYVLETGCIALHGAAAALRGDGCVRPSLEAFLSRNHCSRAIICVHLRISMKTQTKIARYGNSLAIRIPSAIARSLDFREGDAVTVRASAAGVIVERATLSRLEQRLATVVEMEPEFITGAARGREAAE